MGGGRITVFRVILRLPVIKIVLSLGQKFVYHTVYDTFIQYLLKIVFPKFDPVTVTGMALCADLGPKCHNLFCLV